MTAALYRNVFEFLVKQSAETIARNESGRFNCSTHGELQQRMPGSDEYVRGTATVPESSSGIGYMQNSASLIHEALFHNPRFAIQVAV